MGCLPEEIIKEVNFDDSVDGVDFDSDDEDSDLEDDDTDSTLFRISERIPRTLVSCCLILPSLVTVSSERMLSFKGELLMIVLTSLSLTDTE